MSISLPIQLRASITTVLKNDVVRNMTGAFTFGDAATAMLVTAEEEGIELPPSICRTQPKHADLAHYHLDRHGGFNFHMRMAPIAAKTISLAKSMLPDLYDSQAFRGEPDWLITHQIGVRPFERCLKIAGVDRAKSLETSNYAGNVASCSMIVNLVAALILGKVKERDKVLWLSSGSGIGVTEFMFEMREIGFNRQITKFAKKCAEANLAPA